MGTQGNFLYRPSFGASGTGEFTSFDTGLASADAELTSDRTHRLLTSNAHGLVFTGSGAGGGLDVDMVDGCHAAELTGASADETLIALAALNITNGSLILGTGVDVFSMLASGADGSLLHSELGTPEWTSSVDVSEINLPSSDADPGTTIGQIKHDSSTSYLSGGAVKWYDGTNVRLMVDLGTAPTSSDDDKVISYDNDTKTFKLITSSGSGTGNVATDAIWDAVGDLVQGTGDNTAVRLSAGPVDTILRAAGTGSAVGWSSFTLSSPGTADNIMKSDGANWTSSNALSGITIGGFTASAGMVPLTNSSGDLIDSYFLVSGPASTAKTYTLPNASTTIFTKNNLVQTKSVVIKDPTSGSDYPIEWFPYAVTMTEARYVIVGATNWVGQFQEGDANGLNGANTQAADSTVTSGSVVTVSSFSNSSIDANDWVLLKSTSCSGTPTSLSACFSYTIN